MLYLAVKALLSGLIVAAASEAAKSNLLLGALILSLPIVSVLAFVWLWRDTADNDAIATLALSTFWFVLASLPLFRNDFEDNRVVNFASVWILELGIGDIANFDDARLNVHYATVLAHRITPVLAVRGKGHRRA